MSFFYGVKSLINNKNTTASSEMWLHSHKDCHGMMPLRKQTKKSWKGVMAAGGMGGGVDQHSLGRGTKDYPL